jgi:hypothetical protein
MSIEVYSNGIVHCSVCAPAYMTAGEVESATNLKNPVGTSGEWKVHDKPFRSGEPNPCRCSDKPNTHQHWLMVC